MRRALPICSAASMRSTATELSASSGDTSRRAAGAADKSTDASASVATAAGAADEMATSIMEIDRQLFQAKDIVSDAVIEAEQTNKEIIVLAEAAQKIGDVVKLIRDIAGQPISWRSTPPSRRRALARPGAVLRWWPPR